MTDDTKPSIEEIRARWAAATPGPWRHWYDESVEDDVRVCFSRDGVACEWCIALASFEGEAPATSVSRWRADAVFIAHAPSDVAWLLERVAVLEAELAGIRERARAEIASSRPTFDSSAKLGAGRITIYRQVGLDQDVISMLERVTGLKRDGGDGG